MSVYNDNPLEYKDEIPIFSTPDSYTNNYEIISSDHIKSITGKSSNPWIPNDIWNEMESSTFDLFYKYSESVREKAGIKVLDVGVGLGRLLRKITKKCNNLEAYGMDISIPYLKEAKCQGIEVCYSKIEDMPYRENSCDFILCTDVLEHVLALNLCISKILNVLKKNGLLIIRIPFMEDLTPYLEKDYPYDLAHLRNFDRPNLEMLFTKIFQLQILEFRPGLYLSRIGWLKYNLPFRTYWRCLWRILRFISLFSVKFEKFMIRKLFHPIEMNIVLKKI